MIDDESSEGALVDELVTTETGNQAQSGFDVLDSGSAKRLIDPEIGKKRSCREVEDDSEGLKSCSADDVTPHVRVRITSDRSAICREYEHQSVRAQFDILSSISKRYPEGRRIKKPLTDFKIGRVCADMFFQSFRLSVPTQNRKETPLTWAEENGRNHPASKQGDLYHVVHTVWHPACIFPPVVATRVTMHLKAKLGKSSLAVFDPYSGWGDRMVGVTAVAGASYVGVDSNLDLRQAYEDLRQFYGIGDRATFIPGLGEVEIVKAQHEFDVVFSSPPFFYQEKQAHKELDPRAPFRLTEAYPGTTHSYAQFIEDSLFVVFEEVSRRKKDVLLYISETMYSHLVPMVGDADETILFKTNFKSEFNSIYWWSYRAGRAAPSRDALRRFVDAHPFKQKVPRCPKWTKAAVADFELRRERRETPWDISQQSQIIRAPLLKLGYSDADILKVVKNKVDTHNRAKRKGRAKAHGSADASHAVVQAEAKGAEEVGSEEALQAKAKEAEKIGAEEMGSEQVPCQAASDQRSLELSEGAAGAGAAFELSEGASGAGAAFEPSQGAAGAGGPSPCVALQRFVDAHPFKQKVPRCPRWTKEAVADFELRRARRETPWRISQESQIIRAPLLKLGYSDAGILLVVKNKVDTHNRAKRIGRAKAHGSGDTSHDVVQAEAKGAGEVDSEQVVDTYNCAKRQKAHEAPQAEAKGAEEMGSEHALQAKAKEAEKIGAEEMGSEQVPWLAACGQLATSAEAIDSDQVLDATLPNSRRGASSFEAALEPSEGVPGARAALEPSEGVTGAGGSSPCATPRQRKRRDRAANGKGGGDANPGAALGGGARRARRGGGGSEEPPCGLGGSGGFRAGDEVQVEFNGEWLPAHVDGYCPGGLKVLFVAVKRSSTVVPYGEVESRVHH